MLSLYVKMQNKIAGLRNEDGEVSLEYALVGGLMAAAIIAGVALLTDDLTGATGWFAKIGDKITNTLP